MNQNSDWMNNPKLANIDPAKLQMLQSLAMQGSQQNKNDLMSFLMSAANTSRERGMQFSPNEMETIVEVLKMGKTPAEAARIDRMISMMRMMRR